jgi:hypothetical protein
MQLPVCEYLRKEQYGIIMGYLINPVLFFILLIVLLIQNETANAQVTRYVSVSGNDFGGASTCADPAEHCRTIQHAITVAIGGDNIQVTGGIFTGLHIIDKSLSISGAGEGITVIQAHNQAGMASGSVITISGTDHDVAISGVTIRNGNSSGFGGGLLNNGNTITMNEVTFIANRADIGGGIYNTNGILTLTDVTFDANEAYTGGGIFTFGNVPVTISNVKFSNNRAEYGGGMSITNSSPNLDNVIFLNNTTGDECLDSGNGGGMYNTSASPILNKVIFQENSAGCDGGGMYNISNSNPTLYDVIFVENSAVRGGGGMVNLNSSPVLYSVIFSGNQSIDGGGMLNAYSIARLTGVQFTMNNATSQGGGISNWNSSPDLINVLLSGNRAGLGGGIANNSGSSPMIINSTISGNLADRTCDQGCGTGGGIYNTDESFPELLNVIIWGNQAISETEITSSVYNDANSLPVFSYSLIEHSGGSGSGWNQETGTDKGQNLDSDPIFIQMINMDNLTDGEFNLRLMTGSPAIDAGDPETDTGIFIAIENEQPVDLDGNKRFEGQRIDLGAYEFQDTSTGLSVRDVKPDQIELYQNYPNPFNPVTEIIFYMPENGFVTLEIWDLLGRSVAVLIDTEMAAGNHRVSWVASGYPSGVYLYRMTTGSDQITKKLVLVK